MTPDAYTTFDAAGSPVTSTPAAPGTNHCNFSESNLLTVAKMMVTSATKGQVPTSGEIAYVIRKSDNLMLDKNYRAPLLKYYNE